jgi:hypothetical protein
MKLFDAQVQLDSVIEETLNVDFRVPGRTESAVVGWRGRNLLLAAFAVALGAGGFCYTQQGSALMAVVGFVGLAAFPFLPVAPYSRKGAHRRTGSAAFHCYTSCRTAQRTARAEAVRSMM